MEWRWLTNYWFLITINWLIKKRTNNSNNNLSFFKIRQLFQKRNKKSTTGTTICHRISLLNLYSTRVWLRKVINYFMLWRKYILLNLLFTTLATSCIVFILWLLNLWIALNLWACAIMSEWSVRVSWAWYLTCCFYLVEF